jgi:hypothetical protein
MGSDGIARFRLSVWRPAQLGRHMDYALPPDGTPLSGNVFDSARLQEEIYHWHPGQEDVWGCIESPSLSSELRDLFVEGFAPNRSPNERSIIEFQKSVERFGAALSKAGTATWADAMQTVRVSRHEPVNLRGNIALSLWHHMDWIVRTFGSVPGASVTIR